jgi:uncharacterized membrane protein
MENRTLAAIGYLPFFFPLPLYLGKDDEFSRFHGRQSLALLIALIAIWIVIWFLDLILGGILGHIFIVGIFFKIINWIIKNLFGGFVSLLYVFLVILGIANALQGKYWEVPVISAIARRIRV